MRNISPELKAALKDGRVASLVKLTLKDGTVHAYTDHDIQLTVEGDVYVPAPGLAKIRQHQSLKDDVSNQTLQSGWVDAPEEQLSTGFFDEAQIDVGWCSWEQPELGIINTFSGYLGQLTYDKDGFHADIYSMAALLNRNMNLTYTPTCRHKLYGQGGTGLAGKCGKDPAAFTSTGNISSITVESWVFGISTVQADGYYTGATITFTSGYNNGLSFEVKNHASNVVELYLPTERTVTIGDTYIITAGCDKTLATCKARFDNVVNFGGFPSIQPQVNFR